MVLNALFLMAKPIDNGAEIGFKAVARKYAE
jgi:hypothetical protein